MRRCKKFNFSHSSTEYVIHSSACSVLYVTSTFCSFYLSPPHYPLPYSTSDTSSLPYVSSLRPSKKSILILMTYPIPTYHALNHHYLSYIMRRGREPRGGNTCPAPPRHAMPCHATLPRVSAACLRRVVKHAAQYRTAHWT